MEQILEVAPGVIPEFKSQYYEKNLSRVIYIQ
jgi:hypothetical protein